MKEGEFSMASTASAKSQSLHNFNLSFDLKWSTSNSKNIIGDNNSSNSNDCCDASSNGGNNNGSAGRSSKQRTRKFGDSSIRRPPQSDSPVSKEVLDSEKRSRIQVFERVGNFPNVSSSSSDRWIEKSEKKTIHDRLIEKSERKAATGSDRLIVKSEEKKVMFSNHWVPKTEKKLTVSDRLIEKPEKKATVSDHLIEKSEKKAAGSDRLIEKSEKKASVSDLEMEKKAKAPDRWIEKSSEKKAMTMVSDRVVEKSEKKGIFSDPRIEKSEEKLEGSDVKSKFLIRFKAKNKLEDGAAEEGTEAGGRGGGEGEELEVKTWNLRPRKPVSKKPNVNGGISSYTGGGAVLQEINKRPQSPQPVAGGPSKTKNETPRVRTHADAKIVQSKEKKKRLSISLSKEEIEEDVFVMTGSKPARRPKKRAKNVQKQLDSVFPGLWLSSITPDSYKVAENLPKG